MLYNQPFDQTNPNAPYVDGNPSASIMGSIPRAAAIEYPQREIVAAITGSGQTPSNGDLGQLWKAIQRAVAAGAPPVSLWHVGTASGPATSPTVVTVTPPILTDDDLLPCLIRLPQGVATGATLTIGGVSGPFQRNDGSPIQAGDGPPGGDVLVNRHGSAWRLVGFGRTEVQRIVLSPVLWVRPDGDDSNDGSANDAGHAYRSLAAALAAGTSLYNFASSGLLVKLGGPGTYPSPLQVPRGTGTITIEGDAGNQDAYILSGDGGPGQGTIQTAGSLTLRGLAVQNTGAGSHTIAATPGAVVLCDRVSLISTQATSGVHAYGAGGALTLGTNCIIRGSAAAALWGDNGGSAAVNPGAVLAIQGNPTFSIATALATGGRVALGGGASVSGSANGSRYFGTDYGRIQTNGGGPNAFPGTSSGSVNNAIYN